MGRVFLALCGLWNNGSHCNSLGRKGLSRWADLAIVFMRAHIDSESAKVES